MHGIHLVDTDLALEECHRLLKPDGFLCLAWNDRYSIVIQHLCNSDITIMVTVFSSLFLN